MRLLVTGAGGMLGRDVVGAAQDAGMDVRALTHADLDIADGEAVDAVIRAAGPDVAVNCAAWTDVDGAEEAFEDAVAVNGTGAGNLARAATAAGAWMVHISSDYVFDGTKRRPYVETDRPEPLSAYGRSKLAGEIEVVREAAGSHTVLRSSWLFGVHGRCFPSTILRLAAERDELAVVDDQVGCPTFTGHLAEAIIQLASGTPPLGIVHTSASGSCSWYELATRLVELGGIRCELKRARTADMKRPAARPAYSVLGSERDDAPTLADWHQGVEEFMAVRV